MKKYSIGITTFNGRYDMVKSLIYQIRKQTMSNIILAVNNNFNTDFPEYYRKQILELCLEYQNIYPIFFPEQRGLAKLWNSICILSSTDWVLMFNDDLEIFQDDTFFYLEKNINNSDPDLCRINGSFSHFAIHKTILEDLGYFDERLLGFGEEDGDIIFRYIEKYNKNVSEWGIDGIKNIVSQIRDENIRPAFSKYSAFNKEFIYDLNGPKYILDANGIYGSFGDKYIKKLPDLDQYPYEKFFRNNKNKL